MRWMVLLLALTILSVGCTERQQLVQASIDKDRATPQIDVVEERSPVVIQPEVISNISDSLRVIEEVVEVDITPEPTQNTSMAVPIERIEDEVEEIQPPQIIEVSPDSGPNTELASYTESDFSDHASSDDCWIVYQTYIYEASIWIRADPARQVVESYCGSPTAFEILYVGQGGDVASLADEAELVGQLGE